MLMLRTLLADRFKLVFHRESRPTQVYVLEASRNGSKLEKAEDGESNTFAGRGSIRAERTTMDRFAEVLSLHLELPVVNRTGIEGKYNLTLKWAPDLQGQNSDGPTIFTAIQEQLGLRLRSEKIPVETFVIDRAEKPDPN
jgi:uncharacterized protein (TIGR03435 family)